MSKRNPVAKNTFKFNKPKVFKDKKKESKKKPVDKDVNYEYDVPNSIGDTMMSQKATTVIKSTKLKTIRPSKETLTGFWQVVKEDVSSINMLLHILSYRRPAGSGAEQAFVNELCDLVIEMGYKPIFDDYGNMMVFSGNSTTMFSCHTDIVDPLAKSFKDIVSVKKKLSWDERSLLLYSGEKCQLGADDGVGIWLMLVLLQNNTPGTYIFHRDEEIGGKGSMFSSKHLCQQGMIFDRAIAFDRRGTGDVITHQGWQRTASDEFGKELANRLGRSYLPDDTGIFTDTANYTDWVPECTNISVGYESEHTFNEELDLEHAQYLSRILTTIDWETLPTVRDPSKTEYSDWSGFPKYGYDPKTKSSLDNFGYEGYNQYTDLNSKNQATNDPVGKNYKSMEEFVYFNSHTVAAFLEHNGYTIEEITLHDF